MRWIEQFRLPSVFYLLILCPVLVLMQPTQAAISVSLPTEGHYRPGRYMPVRVEGATRQDTITLQGGGAIPTEIPHLESADLIVPWLIVGDQISDARWQLGEGAAQHLALQPLASDERLVGFAGTQQELTQLLFPGKTIIPVQLDESRLLEPAEAWECLDAVVLSASAAARLDEAHRAALLAGGTIIAVHSDDAPDTRWPWKRQGGYWILRYAPAGPQPMVEPDAYMPTYSWDRGWPAAFRRSLVFAAVLFCILSLGTLLWRSRWTSLAFVAVSALFLGGLAIWSARQSAFLQLSLAVRVDAGPISQFDLWTWQSPVRGAESSFAVSGNTHPFVATLRQIEQDHLRLVCRPDGRPDHFTCHLEPMQSLAFLSRGVRLSSPLPALTAAPPSADSFLESLYLRSGDRLEGQYVADGTGTPVQVLVIGGGRR